MTRRLPLHLTVLALILAAVLAHEAHAQTPEEVQAYIVERAEAHGAPVGLALAIARCESGFDPAAVNRSSGATGVYQWVRGGAWLQTPYWTELRISIWFEYATGNPGAWTADVDAGTWALAHGYRSAWAC